MAAAQHAGTMDTDNDDFLEAIFMNENRCQDEGFLEGQAEGRQKGLEEGFRLGCEKGRELGSELGFYLGYTETIKKTTAGLNVKNKERVLKTAENLSHLIEAFPITDPRNPSLEEQVQVIRAKFKQLTSLISVRTEFKTAGQAQGVSF